MKRREFLHFTGVAALAATVDTQAAEPVGPILKRRIPSTGQQVGVIGYGNAAVFSQNTADARQSARELFDVLLEHDGNFADLYIDSVRNLAQALQQPSFRKVVIATGYSPMGEPFTDADMDRVPTLTGKPAIDFLQVRNLMRQGMSMTERYWPVLRKAKEEGKARHIGVTVSDREQIKELLAFMPAERPDFVQLPYSLLDSEADLRALPLALDLGIGVITNRPFANGGYFGRVKDKELPPWAAEIDCVSWAQFNLKFIASHPAVTCVVAESGNPRHARDNLGAGLGRMPDAAMRTRMREFMAGV